MLYLWRGMVSLLRSYTAPAWVTPGPETGEWRLGTGDTAREGRGLGEEAAGRIVSAGDTLW